MENRKIKIYVANEQDDVKSICNKFNIDDSTFYLLNPLLKHKNRLTNLPIKIPYLEESNIRNIAEDTSSKKEEYLELIYLTYLFKNYIMYQTLKELSCEYYKDKIIKKGQISDKNKQFFLDKLIYIVDNYNLLSSDNYSKELDQLFNSKISDCSLYKNMFSSILTYLNLLKANRYYDGEELINNYLDKLKAAIAA